MENFFFFLIDECAKILNLLYYCFVHFIAVVVKLALLCLCWFHQFYYFACTTSSTLLQLASSILLRSLMGKCISAPSGQQKKDQVDHQNFINHSNVNNNPTFCLKLWNDAERTYKYRDSLT